MKMNIAEVVTKFWEYAKKEAENKYQHDVIKGAAYREGIFNGILYASQVEPQPIEEDVEKIHKFSQWYIDEYNKMDVDPRDRVPAIMIYDWFKQNFHGAILRRQLIEKNKPIEEDKTFPYLKSEQDFQIIAMKALGINYPENGSTFEQCVNTVLMLAKKPKEEADKVQKAIEWCESEKEEGYTDSENWILNHVKRYLQSIK